MADVALASPLHTGTKAASPDVDPAPTVARGRRAANAHHGKAVPPGKAVRALGLDRLLARLGRQGRSAPTGNTALSRASVRPAMIAARETNAGPARNVARVTSAV